MARRLRLKMVQSPAARALQVSAAALADVGRWPRRLGESPLRLLASQLTVVEDEFALLDGLTDRIGEFINVHVIDGGFEVPVDLVEVFDFEEADALAAALQELLFALRDVVSFDVTVYVGPSSSTPAKALQELRRAAKEHRVKLPVLRAAQEDEPAPAPEAEGGGGDGPSQKEWGGLDEDEVEEARPMDDAELFFLANARLTWPCSVEQLRVEFRSLARLFHPDKNRGDPNAENTFKLINTGHEGLRRRLEAVP